ncbi:MAG: hypothetical protein JRJ33_04445 [Deltaproteobacteria bacterium]|nr:hypothetical protein [Deltaproteobacteria bacterium]
MYIKMLSGERKPFTFTVPVIFPAIAWPGRHKTSKKTIEHIKFKYFLN